MSSRASTHLLGFRPYLAWHEQCLLQAREDAGDEAFDAAFQEGTRSAVEQAVTG